MCAVGVDILSSTHYYFFSPSLSVWAGSSDMRKHTRTLCEGLSVTLADIPHFTHTQKVRPSLYVKASLSLSIFGRDERIRTSDPLHPMQMR